MLVFTIWWETLIYSLQNLAAIPPDHAYYLIRFWRLDFGVILLETSFWRILFKKIRMCFFKVKHSSTMQFSRTKGPYRQVNSLGWVDVSDSDWVDFPGVTSDVDISSSKYKPANPMHQNGISRILIMCLYMLRPMPVLNIVTKYCLKIGII